MNSFKIITTTAITIILIIILLLMSFKNHQLDYYNQTVDTLMVQQNLSSHEAVFQHFPELHAIKSDIEKVANLKRDMQSIALHPNSIFLEEPTIKLEGISKRIEALNLSINNKLSQLLTASQHELKTDYVHNAKH